MSYSDDDLAKMMSHFGNPEQRPFDLHEEKVLEDHILLENIIVRDRGNKDVEVYNQIYIPKNPLVRSDVSGIEDYAVHNINGAERYLSKRGRFLPSSPLLSTIITQMFIESIKFDGAKAEILDEDKYNWINYLFASESQLLVNSVIDYDAEVIKHYPDKSEIELDIEESVPDTFNAGRPNYVMGVPNISKQNYRFMGAQNDATNNVATDAIVGSSTHNAMEKAIGHFVPEMEIQPLASHKGNQSITIGNRIYLDHEVKDAQIFTYCMLPGGDW